MELSKPKPNFHDDRGFIKDILTNETIEHVTVIHSKKGVVRGNHYHKDTIQWVYLHSGKLNSLTQMSGDKYQRRQSVVGSDRRRQRRPGLGVIGIGQRMRFAVNYFISRENRQAVLTAVKVKRLSERIVHAGRFGQQSGLINA